MSPENADRVRQHLLDVMRVETFYPPADASAIAAAEAKVRVAFPHWLRELYLACNGFRGPTQWEYLIPLEGREGLVEFTEFLRAEDWAPPWLSRAVVFGSDINSGTLTTHFVALDGKLVTWTLGDAGEFVPFDGTVYDLYRREQAGWDELKE